MRKINITVLFYWSPVKSFLWKIQLISQARKVTLTSFMKQNTGMPTSISIFNIAGIIPQVTFFHRVNN